MTTKTPAHTSTNGKKLARADQYDDPSFNYQDYWQERGYEHSAEELAIRKLIGTQHFKTAVDVGGGYGRLCILLENFADTVILAEPSQQQLDIAQTFLKKHPRIESRLEQAESLSFQDGSIDLVTLIRVMHHLPQPEQALHEIHRILKPGGLAIIEVANYAHFRNRLKHLFKGQSLPKTPVDIRSAEHRHAGEIPFVNHNPLTILAQLSDAGLRVEKTLSVSNLRSPRLKKLLPKTIMLRAEQLLQAPLAGMYFGPSIFFLVRK